MMSLYQFFAKVSKRSDLPDPSGLLSTSISSATIKEASVASVIVYRTYVRALATSCACVQYLPQQAYEIKKYEILF